MFSFQVLIYDKALEYSTNTDKYKFSDRMHIIPGTLTIIY